MKATHFKFFVSMLALAIFMMVSTESYSQTKGSTVKTQSSTASGSITSVTKVFEFSSGGIDIKPLSGDVTYTVHEKATLSATSWTKTDSGTVKPADGKVVEICKTAAAAIKVEIKLLCDSCAEVTSKACQ